MTTNNYQLNSLRYGTHQIVCSFLKANKSVLDVGCNDGYLKKIFPRAKFTGLDFSDSSLKLAKKNGYLSVKKCNLNEFSKVKVRSHFDYLIFADVLEHLLFPDQVLKYFVKENLKKGGTVIISLPNVAHLSVRLGLLIGKFDYTDAGILDRTHLHLYTKATARKLIQESGLKIVTCRYSSNHFGWLIRVFPFLSSLLGFNLIFSCKKV